MREHILTISRPISFIATFALAACSGSGTSSTPAVARAPIAQSSAPASAPSQTQATFVVHWPAAGEATTVRGRKTLSPSTQSVSVSVNGGPGTVVNKPTLTGSPSTTSISIAAPPGNDQFTFTAWDKVDASGAILDQSTVSQNIIANDNNAISVVLDGVCAALVPTIATTAVAPFGTYQDVSIPLASGSRSVLQSAQLIGPTARTFNFTPVDADGNTILSSAGTASISVLESGTKPHVTIAPLGTGASNTAFTITPILAEPDGASTTITATSPDCGTNSPTFPSSFQISTTAEIVVADAYAGLVAYDQDGHLLETLSSTPYFSGVAYNASSGYLVAIRSNSGHGIAFQTLKPTGAAIGSGTFTPSNVGTDTNAPTEDPGQIVYDPGSGDFFLTLQGSSTTVGGAIEQYSIVGSTATFVNSADATSAVDPVSITMVPNGLIFNDENSTNVSNSQADTYEYSASSLSFETNINIATTSLSFDSMRGDIIGFTPSTSSTAAGGYIFAIPFSPSIDTFTTPSYDGTNYQASAYSPGNDELYFFDTFINSPADSYGLSGSTVYAGGSTSSNLNVSAFSGLVDINAAVALP